MNRQNKIESIVLSLMYLAMLAVCYISSRGWEIWFTDTDDYMRVLRIKEFFTHFDLSNTVIARSNYPEGCDLHWTRLYDFFLIGLTYVFNFFLKATEKSIECACFCMSPILGLVCLQFVFRIFNQFMNKENILLAAALFCASPFLIPFFAFGRPDHHAFIMTCMLAYLYVFTKIVKDESNSKNLYTLAAVITTACVWASPETLIVLIISDAVLLLCYFNNYEKLACCHFKNLMTACLIGIVISFPLPDSKTSHTLAMCLLLLLVPYTTLRSQSFHADPFFKYWHFVCLLFMVILLPGIHSVEYDKISVVHMALFMCASIYFAINMNRGNSTSRVYDAVVWAVAIGIVFLSLYPRFLQGMEGDIPPLVKEIWLKKILELKSPLASPDSKLCFVAYALITSFAIKTKVRDIWKKPLTATNVIWWEFIALASVYLILAAFAFRMIPYSAAFGIPLVVHLGMSSEFTKHLNKIYRMLITMFLAVLFTFVTAIFVNSNSDKKNKPQYSKKELYRVIDGLSDTPAIIMAHSNYGPELLYYTKHRVLGAPYHRQCYGIICSYAVTEMKYDENIIRKVFKNVKPQFIFVKRSERFGSNDSFAARIVYNNYPKWISIVPIPKKFSDVVVAKVNQDLFDQEKF